MSLVELTIWEGVTMAATPWAILLCKFSDDNTEPYPRQRYEELFTTAGAGKFNMVDFFDAMSHGMVDISGSRVFGWLTVNKKRSDYLGSGPNPQGRQDLISWARQAAADQGIDLTPFFSVLVSMNVPTDLFGGPNGVVCDGGSLSPSMLGQEMGHAYGLNHSRADGSSADYMDPWDVMSAASAFMAPHPFFQELDQRGNPLFTIGPGLNAANMWGRGWVDLSRVWIGKNEQLDTTVELRPLHRRDLPGYLAARIGEYFFEFRMPELWDSGIGNAVILVHDFSFGYSYLCKGDSGLQGLTAGDQFHKGDLSEPFAPLLNVKVGSIDVVNRVASLTVTLKCDRRPKAGPAVDVVGGTSDAGGYVLIGGKMRRIPPWGPLTTILESVVSLGESEELATGPARDLMQREALEKIRDQASTHLERMQAFRQPTSQVFVREGER